MSGFGIPGLLEQSGALLVHFRVDLQAFLGRARWKSSWLDPALDYIEGRGDVEQHVEASCKPAPGSKPKTDSHLNQAGVARSGIASGGERSVPASGQQ